jgi:hypothetical protein
MHNELWSRLRRLSTISGTLLRAPGFQAELNEKERHIRRGAALFARQVFHSLIGGVIDNDAPRMSFAHNEILKVMKW